ncbi:hypothetical protein IID22_05010 [Patescibacteria group bacterium]|nr:hypothetical protein [Patescibacteria group bacterium]
MGETGDRLRGQIRRAKWQTEKALHDLSEIKRETKKELKDVEIGATPILDEKRYPKILMFSANKSEYTSVRKVAGDRLETEFRIPLDVESTEMTLFIPSNLLPDDGMIGIVGIPWTHNATPKDEKDIKFINEKTDYNDDDGFSHIMNLQHFLLSGGVYKKENWDFSESYLQIRTIKRVGGRFFMLISDIAVQELKPNDNGDLEILHRGYYWAEEEIEIQKELNRKYGVFYAVIKGSSEKEEKRQEVPAKQKLASQMENAV